MGSGSSGSTGNGNSRHRSSSRDQPPQLPPRDGNLYGTSGGPLHATAGIWANDDYGGEPIYGVTAPGQGKDKESKKKNVGDDPYYFGLSARIPNFVKGRKKKQKERDAIRARNIPSQEPPNNVSTPGQMSGNPSWWQPRLYTDSSGSPVDGYSLNPHIMVPYGTDSSDSDYSYIYGRHPLPSRGLRKFP